MFQANTCKVGISVSRMFFKEQTSSALLTLHKYLLPANASGTVVNSFVIQLSPHGNFPSTVLLRKFSCDKTCIIKLLTTVSPVF